MQGMYRRSFLYPLNAIYAFQSLLFINSCGFSRCSYFSVTHSLLMFNIQTDMRTQETMARPRYAYKNLRALKVIGSRDMYYAIAF